MESRVTEKNNFVYLTVALVLLLLGSALAQSVTGLWGRMISSLLVLLPLVAAYVSLRFSDHFGRFVLWTMGLWVIAGAIGEYTETGRDVVHLLILLVFFFSIGRRIGSMVLMTGSVDGNKVVGSIALFLIIGLGWTVVYLLIVALTDGAFNGLADVPWNEGFSHAAYFSFVTLTTLGFGDVSPIHPVAEVFVYLEATAGVFYMAIVVASLVSAHLARNEKSHEGGKYEREQ